MASISTDITTPQDSLLNIQTTTAANRKYCAANVINAMDDDIICFITTGATSRVRTNRHKVQINGHHRQLIQQNEKGNKSFHLSIRRTDASDCLFRDEITTCVELTITHKQKSDFGDDDKIEAADAQIEVCRTRLTLFLPLIVEKDYFHLLELSRDATQQDLDESCERLSKMYDPDKLNHCPESILVTQNLSEAYEILSDENLRREHERAVDYGRGFFSRARCRLQLCDSRRSPWLIPTTVMIAGGITITVNTSNLALPFLLMGGAAGGSLLSSGLSGLLFTISRSSAVYGMNYAKLAKVIAINAVMGAIVGCACSWISVATLPQAIAAALPSSTATSNFGCLAVTGATCAAVDGMLWGAGNVLAQLAAGRRWKHMTAWACIADVLKGLLVGMIFGAVFGALLGIFSALFGGECAIASRTNEVANVAGAVQGSARVAIVRSQASAQSVLQPTGGLRMLGGVVKGVGAAAKQATSVATNKTLDKVLQFGTTSVVLECPISSGRADT